MSIDLYTLIQHIANEHAMKKQQVKTPEEVKREFEERGQSIAEWSRKNNLSVFTVYRVLKCASAAKRGESHRAAVLLGLKQGVVVQAGA
jgi:gp16 family phage-associated protein